MNYSNNTSPVDLSRYSNEPKSAWWKRLNGMDVVFAIATLALFGFGALKTWHLMDYYEVIILVGGALVTIAMGWFWRPLQVVFICVTLLSLAAVGLYQGQLQRGDSVFWLKYMLGSQPAVMWMSVLFGLATLTYWANVFLDKPTLSWLASRLTYAALIIGTTALMVRWHESYLIAPDVGHIPVSNLYEVFILFALLTTAFYLYYENLYKTAQLGPYVMLVICMAVGFLLWYSIERGANDIKPLIPALQSWWMKIHVPANFIGYGTFSLAAMVALAYLIKFVGTPYELLPAAFRTPNDSGLSPADMAVQHAKKTRIATIVLWILGALLFAEPLMFRGSQFMATYWAMYMAIGLVVVGAMLMARRRLAAKLPDFEVLDDIMYKSIAVGFVFFTIATILGALWAADAWGKYWSWDPKETWALVVWLNYAAWLHLRLVAGLRGVFSAYWALIGLLITGFAFVGVNVFLSGLHSYGGL